AGDAADLPGRFAGQPAVAPRRPRRPRRAGADQQHSVRTCTPARTSTQKKAAQEAAFQLLRTPRVAYGRRASSASSRALGSRSCLVTLSTPRVSKGHARKIEDRVPITAPIIWLRARPSSEPPPYRYRASTDRKNTSEVMMVRDRVWLIDRLNTSSGSTRRLRKFSRTRSNTTMVSLIEKPITASRPARTVRSKSRPLQAKKPATTSTSNIVVRVADTANLNSKRKPM